MREILFRAKRIDNGEWVEGYYAAQSNHACIANELKYQHFIFKDVCFDFDLGRLQEFEVIPETVGQYTGLTDRNGKPIFEGDIIKSGSYEFLVSHGKCGGCANTDNYGYIGFHLEPANEETKFHMGHGLRDDIYYYTEAEVMGNIHDIQNC